MPKYDPNELDVRLGQFLAPELPEHPSSDINLALRVAGLLETRGFTFNLKDMCPKSLSESLWQASFCTDAASFEDEAGEPAVAVCSAALKALEGTRTH